MNARVYDQITERILALLAQGTVPWHKPWKARTGLPRNHDKQNMSCRSSPLALGKHPTGRKLAGVQKLTGD